MSACRSVLNERPKEKHLLIRQHTFANSQPNLSQARSFSRRTYRSSTFSACQLLRPKADHSGRGHCLEWNNLSSIINCEFTSFSSLNNQSSAESEAFWSAARANSKGASRNSRPSFGIVEHFAGTIRRSEVLAYDSRVLLARTLVTLEILENIWVPTRYLALD